MNQTFSTPAQLCEAIYQLAIACSALQECNNDITMFLTRNNADTSFLLHSIPASTETLIGKRKARVFLEEDEDEMMNNTNKKKTSSSSYFIEVLLVLHPDAEEVCVALELEGIRVTECWACHSSQSVYVAVKIKSSSSSLSTTEGNSNSNDQSIFLKSSDKNEIALNQFFAKNSSNNNSSTLLVLGNIVGVTRLEHTVLDDLHRMLEWHEGQVEKLYHQVYTGSSSACSSSSPSRLLSCWNFIMDSFGSTLADLVRDIRMELDQVVSSAAEASDQAFHQLESALAEFRKNNYRNDNNNNNNNKNNTTSSSSLKQILDSFSHAVAHEVAGEEDLKARDLVFEMWSWFELLGIGYEKVVSKVPEFKNKLLVCRRRITTTTTVHDNDDDIIGPNRSLRSFYQEAVDLMRACYFNDQNVSELDQYHRDGPRTKKLLEMQYGKIIDKLQYILDQLVKSAQETDVFAGDLTVAELWSSDYRCFQDYVRTVDEKKWS